MTIYKAKSEVPPDPLREALGITSKLIEFNPNHDERGQFASGPGGASSFGGEVGRQARADVEKTRSELAALEKRTAEVKADIARAKRRGGRGSRSLIQMGNWSVAQNEEVMAHMRDFIAKGG